MAHKIKRIMGGRWRRRGSQPVMTHLDLPKNRNVAETEKKYKKANGDSRTECRFYDYELSYGKVPKEKMSPCCVSD